MNIRPTASWSWHTWLPSRGNVLFTLLMAFGLLFYTNTVGAVPARVPATSTSTIAYQGRLADASGTPINGVVVMTFRLYDNATVGNELWVEDWPAVQVNGGLFNVLLGSTTPITPSIFSDNDSLWLGVTVGGDSEMTPRVQLGSVPFAIQSLVVPPGAITTTMIAEGAVTSAKIGGEIPSLITALVFTSTQIPFFNTNVAGSWVDVTGSTLSITVDQPAILLISFAGSMFMQMDADSAFDALLTLNLDNVDRTDLLTMDFEAWSGTAGIPNPAITPASFQVLAPVDPGTHTVKLRMYMWGNWGVVTPNIGIGYNGRPSTLAIIAFGQ